MNLAQLIEAGVHRGDLTAVDTHFTQVGVTDLNGIIQLKAAFVALANVADFELTVRPTYKTQPEPSAIIRPLLKNLTFAKYLRNKVVGHIHPELVAKAIEWQPTLRAAPGHLDAPEFVVLVNLWLLETAINTYVEPDGRHKIFDTETDVFYPPNWSRFMEFLKATIRGSIAYLQRLYDLWAPTLPKPTPGKVDVEAVIRAGQTEFKFLRQ